MIASRRRKVSREPTVALINIVFLILIFFMVAGSLAKMPQGEIEYVFSDDLECCAPVDVLVIDHEGNLSFNAIGFSSAAEFLRANPVGEEPLRILPDRRLEAAILLSTIAQLRASGADQLRLVVEQQ